MKPEELTHLLNAQKKFFADGNTLPIANRKRALKHLYQGVCEMEEQLCQALKKDLGKSASEAYMCEIGLVKSEISYMLKHLGKFAREKRVHTPLAHFASRSFRKPSPYGNVLVMSPWNYPVLLTLGPVIDALAAGNTVMVKPSAYSPATTAALQQLLAQCFSPEFVAVVTGGREENQYLLDMPFDYIFFTGGKTVGREVLRHAAEKLIPVTLELGGKSPCIVTEDANIPLAAKRIVFGKFINCGQTCVAPDYIYCHSSVQEQLVDELKKQIQKQYGENPLLNPDYGKIINEKHFVRLMGLIDSQKVVFGGEGRKEELKIAPTVMKDVTFHDAVMGEEIFGPVLPILTYERLSEMIDKIRALPSPLALYVFSSDKRKIKKITETVSFGGGCINDTLIHLATSEMAFGGVGESGMGSYHGKKGFDTFTHEKSIVDKKTFLDLPIRYQPYTKTKDAWIRKFLQ